MRVIVAAPTYLPARRANTLQVMKMAQAVDALGYDLRVLVPDPFMSGGEAWAELEELYGLQKKFNIEWIPVRPRFRGYDYGIKIVQQSKNWNADILYTRLPQAAAFASIRNISTIFEIHDLPGGVMGHWLVRKFLNGRGARQLVLITQALNVAIEKEFGPIPKGVKRVIAPDGVDLVRYKNLPEPRAARQILSVEQGIQLPVDQFTVGYTGHLYPGRGINHVLAIAPQIPDMTFLLVGGDPEDVKALRSDVKSHSLDNVIVTGFVPNADLPKYQAACDILIMPYQETVEASSGGDIAQFLSPMKMFEYLACGRVIVSSDLPVLREVLNEQNAVLLPPTDVAAWVGAIGAVRGDRERRKSLSEAARKDSYQYSWESRAELIFTGVGS